MFTISKLKHFKSKTHNYIQRFKLFFIGSAQSTKNKLKTRSTEEKTLIIKEILNFSETRHEHATKIIFVTFTF